MERAILSSAKVTIAFGFFAIGWILLSDYAVEAFITDPEIRGIAQTYKGLASVFFTTIILFLLVLRSNRALEKANDIDSLTGLLSHSTFSRALEASIKQIKPGNRIILGFLDIDNFKMLNETVGFEKADKFLAELARDVRQISLADSFVSRAHADQFASFAILNDKNFNTEAHVEGFKKTFNHRANLSQLDVTCSIGIALYPNDGITAKELMVAATNALQMAKSRRNAIQFHDPALSQKALERHKLISDLRAAIREQHLTVVYQPKYNISSNAPSGIEVLARWHHPQLGFISPDIFIPLAEENGLMGAISKVIINKASQELAATDILGRVIKHVSVNVSATEFNNVADMHALIAFIKQETKLAPFIRIEITETATLSDMSKSTEIIAGLQAQGVTLSIDDFGTGYTSLAMLKDLTVDELKIDRSFIAELEHDQRSRTIVSAVIAMAEKFNINTVAEGIETEVQLEMLKAMGCNEAQGFLLGRPMPLDALLSHINKPD